MPSIRKTNPKMPPRWMLCAVIAVYSISGIKSILAAEKLNTLPVASNGWRPIVGQSPVKSYVNIDHVQSPSQKQTVSLTANNEKYEKNHNKVTAKPTKTVPPNHIHINHHGSTGQHINVKLPHIVGSGKPALRHPVLGKLHAHLSKRPKPPTSTRSPSLPLPRDEIMAPAPSSAIGSYAYFNQGPISIQNTQHANNKHFNSGGHVDFSNHFAFSNINNDIVLPHQHQYQQFQKHIPNQNDIHTNQNYIYFNQNDDFSRNLVPPPPIYKPQGEKETLLTKDVGKYSDQHSQLIIGKPENVNPPDNVILVNQYHQYQPQNYDLEISKEKFKEYHSTVSPNSYKSSTESYSEGPKYTKPREQYTKPASSNYEVTEEKEWLEPGFKPVLLQKYHQQQDNRFQYQFNQPQDESQFLPTPYNPDNAFPTSPTQADVSTIYSEITNKKKIRVPTTTSYNLKEVATHFPIFNENRSPINSVREEVTTEEITTRKPVEQYNEDVQYTKQTVPTRIYPTEEIPTFPPRVYPTRKVPVDDVPDSEQVVPNRGHQGQRRPGNRRRRPTKTQTTTDAGVNTEVPDVVESVETERTTLKPQRRRRPVKYRTTSEAPTTPQSVLRSTYRPRTTRPEVHTVIEEEYVNKNHRYNTRPYQTYILDDDSITYKVDDTQALNEQGAEVEENVQPVNTEPSEEEIVKDFRNTESLRNSDARRRKVKPYQTINLEEELGKYETTRRVENDETTEQVQDTNFQNHRYTETTRNPEISKRKRIRITSTTEPISVPNTNLNIPENELDYTTISNVEQYEPFEEIATVQEVKDFEPEFSTNSAAPISFSTTSTTASTTSTTTEATRTTRLRRPIKYDVQRPRFSVKEYRQRLNQHTSTESTRSAESTPRIRYSNRLKSSTTTGQTDDESTESVKQKFVPKERRKYGYSTESSDGSSTTERTQRTISTRLKQFNRYRFSTEPSVTSSTTQRVVIKPNIFNNLKRPNQLSLRNRIFNKKRNSTTTSTTTTEAASTSIESEEESTEKVEPTIPFETAESQIEITTQAYRTKSEVPTKTEKPTTTTATTSDEEESFLQLQRIQDLTSSAHKQYNTPGLFKSMPPTSRRVPSYFTIATEDPILPIEAFFSNVNQKN